MYFHFKNPKISSKIGQQWLESQKQSTNDDFFFFFFKRLRCNKVGAADAIIS